MLKKILPVLSVVIFLAAMFAGCEAIEGTIDEVRIKAEEQNHPNGRNQPIVVSVSPSTVTITRGQSQQFTATVTGTSNDTVTWAVTGGNGDSSINSTGLLSVSITEEPDTILTVSATSVADTSKKGTAAATVSLLINGLFRPLAD